MIKSSRHSRTIYPFIVALVLILLPLTENVASAATYYVATTGNDSNSCATAQNISTPKRTIGSGISCMASGDTLSIRGGTYAERITSVPSGTSWTSPTTVKAYSGETVTLQPGTLSNAVVLLESAISYVIIDGLIIDAINQITDHTGGVQLWGSHHVRFQNCEIKNAYGNGAYQDGATHHIEFVNCKIYDNGRWGGPGYPDQPPGFGRGHGVYVGSSYNLIDGCDMHHNGEYAVHVYSGVGPTDNNIVRNNKIYVNGQNTTRYGGPAYGGITIGRDNNLVYNNLVYNQIKNGIDIAYDNPSNSQVYNNTIYNNPGTGLYIGGESVNARVINNISYSNGSNITNSGSGTTLSNNLTTIPSFVNAAGLDFHLSSASAAIDAGTTLSAVPKDKDGKTRPQGSTYDIGAYEFASADTTPPAAPTGLTIK